MTSHRVLAPSVPSEKRETGTRLIQKQMVSPKGAAEMLAVSTRTIRRYVKAGKLPASYVSARTIRIRVADIETLMRENAA